MRLHRMEVSGFGAFAARQVIDFDPLSESGIFLIGGPTGAGKTTLLDAISFALFGTVPGARGRKQLKSQHTDPGEVPEVILEVTLRGRRLRIRRTPQFTRPGRKTPVQASVTLEERRGTGWQTSATRLDESGRILEDLLGMTAEQFHRVVVLPQGDFAAFLRASNDERGDLLRRLFDVSTFGDVEDWLIEERKRLEHAVRDAERDLGALRDRLVRSVGLGDPTSPSEPEAPDDPLPPAPLVAEMTPRELAEFASGCAARGEQQALAALADADIAQGRLSLAEQALEDATALAALIRRGRVAHDQIAQLDDASAEIAANRDRLERGREAATVWPLTLAADRSARAVDLARTSAQSHLSVLTERLPRWRAAAGGSAHDDVIQTVSVDDPAPDGDPLDDLTRGLAAHQDSIDRIDTLASALHLAVEAIPRQRESAAEATRQTDIVREALGDLALRLDADQPVIDRAAAAAATTGELLTRQTALQRQAERLTALDEHRTQQVAATEAHLMARGEVEDARASLHDLQQRRLADMAGELASHLADGSPCQVCGSEAHPQPAVRSDDVDQEAIDAAEATVERARAGANSAAQRLHSATAHVDGLEIEVSESADALGLDPGHAAVATARAQLTDRLAQLDAAVAEGAAAEARRQAATTEQQTLSESLSSAERAAAAANALLQQAETAARDSLDEAVALVGSHARDCPCSSAADAHGDIPAVVAVDESAALDVSTSAAAFADRLVEIVDSHRATREACQGALNARDALAHESARHQQDAAELEAGLREAQFADRDALTGAHLTDAHIRELAELVHRHDSALAAAHAVLGEEGMTAALAGAEPDVVALGAALASAKESDRHQQRRLVHARHQAKELEGLSAEISAIGADLAPVAERHATVRDLAELASGRGPHNPDRVSLTTYVLVARLERIVALANERLATLADGRYQLGVDHGRSDGRQRGGLGLLVHDGWTSEQRPATTLSGGETFMASLALALGTADAVREEAGGVDLETLFIDEGFGSLDDAALEEVMTVLDGLRAGGRSVGVISHVADMRTRIPSQVTVRRSPTGSSVSVRDVA